MEILNATRMVAGYTLGIEPSGREHIVVVVKGTFAIPERSEEGRLSDEQAPLVMADTFTGEPGFSAPVYESDYCLRKPYCDVLLNGSAHAPAGRRVQRTRVGLRVGSIHKEFDVVGDRVWKRGWLGGLRPSRPKPFTSMPISYDRAYGGIDDSHPEKTAAYLPNIVGVGYHPRRPRGEVAGRPVPNTEEPGRPVSSLKGKYRPMSFGPIGRNFPPRPKFAGTYDQRWLDEVFPFLPADFDFRYFQSAPPDQQMDYPRGGEEVELTNLTPSGRLRFRLPAIEVPVEFTNASYERTEAQATLDTVVIEPDASRMIFTWRVSHPLKRNMLEMRQVVVGKMTRGWYRARELGKIYKPLGSLVEA
jgi:hypothetical protein